MGFLDGTSLTLDEFQHLVPPFEAAFHVQMAAWRMDGTPRMARRCAVDKNCPLPTPEDRLLFILVSRKTYALQVVHGRLFGMAVGKETCNFPDGTDNCLISGGCRPPCAGLRLPPFAYAWP